MPQSQITSDQSMALLGSDTRTHTKIQTKARRS